jgi:hypothetical protein
VLNNVKRIGYAMMRLLASAHPINATAKAVALLSLSPTPHWLNNNKPSNFVVV